MMLDEGINEGDSSSQRSEHRQRVPATDTDLAFRASAKADDMRVMQMARDLLATEDWTRAMAEQAVPEPISVRALLDMPPVNSVPHIDGFVPGEGKAVFSAPAKGGKTTTVMNMVHSLVTGEPFLGHFATSDDARAHLLQVHVIDNERTTSDLHKWYARMNLPEEAQGRVTLHPIVGHAATFDMRVDASRAWWVERLKGADVVILDCLSPFLASLGLDENHEAGAWLAGVDALMAFAGVKTYVVVHHTGHAGERARGDSKILGWPNQLITLTLGADDPDDVKAPRFIKAHGRMDRTVDSGQVTFDSLTGMLTYHEGRTRAKAKADKVAAERWRQVRDAILEQVGPGEWVRSGRVSEWVGRDKNTVLKALRYGVAEGSLTTRPNGGGSGEEFCLVRPRTRGGESD